jgi:hypothetical protein
METVKKKITPQKRYRLNNPDRVRLVTFEVAKEIADDYDAACKKLKVYKVSAVREAMKKVIKKAEKL